jgi:hypothetical protein
MRHRKQPQCRRAIDWHAIRQDSHTGALSLREMAQKHGCSHSTIANHATRNGWSRNAFERSAASLKPTPSSVRNRPRSVPARVTVR